MLKFADYDIVFQEIPGEVTLAINISNCPNKCKGCHSAYLMDDVGTLLTENTLDELLVKYGNAITCVCFMGGDADPSEVMHLARYIHKTTPLKTAWYSGKPELPADFEADIFQYVKIGPYIPQYGGLKEKTTNQRLFRITEHSEMVDITGLFWKK